MRRHLHGPREADEGNVVGLHPLLPPRPPQVLDPALNLVLLVLDDILWRNLENDFRCDLIGDACTGRLSEGCTVAVGFVNSFLRVRLMYQPCCLVPCCQGKPGGISKKVYLTSQYSSCCSISCEYFNAYKLCGTVALDVIAVALGGDVVLSQGDVLQFVAILEAVRGRQDVPPVDQGASAFVLDAPGDIYM